MDKVIETRRELERGRTATEGLLSPLSDDELATQLSPRVPPLTWMLAHIARFEELWILRTIGGA
ncbi:MAG TPA: DinB family protein, partial [Gaiellaceae bacterium]|nr:DinB family protein [Gaiellaceae bacterium]